MHISSSSCRLKKLSSNISPHKSRDLLSWPADPLVWKIIRQDATVFLHKPQEFRLLLLHRHGGLEGIWTSRGTWGRWLTWQRKDKVVKEVWRMKSMRSPPPPSPRCLVWWIPALFWCWRLALGLCCTSWRRKCWAARRKTHWRFTVLLST